MPHLYAVADSCHRGVGSGSMHEHMVEEQSVARFEDGPADPQSFTRLFYLVGRRRPIENRPCSSCLDDVIQTAGKNVEARRVVAARCQSQPQVHSSDVRAHERTVLVPRRVAALAGDPAKGGFLDGERWLLSQMGRHQSWDAGRFDGFEQIEEDRR
jgi:hypothetical protein